MTYLPHAHSALARPTPPLKRRRRTATSVLAGDFDPRPQRDVLTHLLNGVRPYRPPLTPEELIEKEVAREKRRERERLGEAERERRRKEKRGLRDSMKDRLTADELYGSSSKSKRRESNGPRDFWSGRPSVSSDATPDELSDDDSCMSQPSSKRPYTPPDDEMRFDSSAGPSRKRSHHPSSTGRRPGRPAKKKRVVIDVDAYTGSGGYFTDSDGHIRRREPKKRVAHKKGWKGWVAYEELGPEEAPDPSKLIELDRAIVLEDRRTRSGKNFDAISEGKDSWV